MIAHATALGLVSVGVALLGGGAAFSQTTTNCMVGGQTINCTTSAPFQPVMPVTPAPQPLGINPLLLNAVLAERRAQNEARRQQAEEEERSDQAQQSSEFRRALVHRHRRMIQSKSQSSKGLRHAAVHHPSESVH
jgi:hypothetical protein